MVLRICIVIPVYNEETVIERNLKTIIEYAQALPQPATVVAVNDGSSDNTETILKELSKNYTDSKFQVISYPDNKGYGGALRIGMKFAIDQGYDYTLFMDSDLTNHPKYLTLFYSKMQEGCDYIKATRYSKGGGMKGVPWKRRLFSRAGNALAGVLFGLPLTDMTNGFRVVKTRVLKKLELHENGFPIIMEELYQAKKITRSFCEVPFILTNRQQEQRDTSFPYTFRTIGKYLKYSLKSFFKL